MALEWAGGLADETEPFEGGIDSGGSPEIRQQGAFDHTPCWVVGPWGNSTVGPSCLLRQLH